MRRPGVIDGEQVAPIELPDLRALFERGHRPRGRAARERAPRRSRTCACTHRSFPKKFFHTSGNFREHEDESKVVGWSHEIAPWIVFFQNVDAIIGPDEPIIYPEHLTDELDHELELAVIIGQRRQALRRRRGRRLHRRLHDLQRHHRARHPAPRDALRGLLLLQGDRHASARSGPWIVTPDEVGDPHDLEMRLRVNGELRQESNTSHMSVTIPQILAHYSALGYSPGDIVSTGTVSGVAGFRENAAEMYLRPGDVVECEIERIGTLSNPVISWQDAYGVPAPPLRRW